MFGSIFLEKDVFIKYILVKEGVEVYIWIFDCFKEVNKFFGCVIIFLLIV